MRRPSPRRIGLEASAAARIAIRLLAVLWLGGCGGADRGAQATRPSAADSAHLAPAAVAKREAAPPAVPAHDSAPAADPSREPVMVGGDEDFDACGGVDEAIGPVAVHSGPGDRFAVTDQLGRGARVYVCGGTPDEKWAAVVIIPREGAESCSVSSPIATRQAYSGPCRSGWVREDSLAVIAG